MLPREKNLILRATDKFSGSTTHITHYFARIDINGGFLIIDMKTIFS